MLKLKLLAGGFAALLALGIAAPASAQGLCSGPLGSGVCGAGIGGGLGAALGGRKGAQTGAIIGGVYGLTQGYQQQQYYRRPPPPVYYQPRYAAPAPGYCNVQACSYSYKSFRAYDCTFQPYNGPRRYCTK